MQNKIKYYYYKSKIYEYFLPCYLIIQIIHGWEYKFEYSFWLGLIIAIIAHSRKNILTILILFSHMAIEWFEWGSGNIVFLILLGNIFHAGMDFTFLHHEIKVHIKKNSLLIFGGVFFILLIIFSIASKIKISEGTIENIHPFVLGGVIGCVASHIYFHFKKENKIFIKE